MLFRVGFRFLASAALMVLAAGCLSSGSLSSPGARHNRSVPGSSSEAEKNRIEAHAHFATAIVHEFNREMEKALEEYFLAASKDLSDEALVLDVSRRLVLARQTEKAVELVSQAVELPGASAELFARLGFLYAQLNQTDRAIHANRTAIRRDPRLLFGYQNLVLIYLQSRDNKEAYRVLEQASKVDGVDGDFLIGLGQLYVSYGAQTPAERELANSRAVAILQSAAKMTLTDPQLHVRLANAFNMLGRDREAAAVFEELLKQVRDVPMLRDGIRARLADIYLRSRDNERAASQLESLLRDNPTDVQAYYYLGELAEDEGQFAQAVEHYSKVLLLNPELELGYYKLANAQISADKTSEALETLARARGKFPASFFLEYLSAVAFTTQEQFTNAVSHFTTAEILAATEPDLLTHLFYFQHGAACERMGDYAQAEKKFEKCLELNPAFAEAQNYLGYMFAERGEQLERAHDLISQALKAEPESAAYLDSMGWVLFKMKRHEEALKYLLDALKHSEEDDAVLFEHLGDIYAALSQPEKAREAWSKSVEIEDRTEVRKKLESVR